jgi:hypothetical protein
MSKKREAIKEKARAKRQRRAESKSAGKADDEKKAQVADPNATLTEKVIDLAQGAAAEVGNLVKAAAQKITGTTSVEVAPSSE